MNEGKRKLLIDFGSTFTKVVFVDLARNEIIAKTKHYSTVETDVTIGLKACLKKIEKESGVSDLSPGEALACSSAAGGLRIVCVGFVPDYSSKAANLAALGAGAKVVGCFSYEITKNEIAEIKNLHPDIILLTGGTDGGNKKVIIHNAGMLADSHWEKATIIAAGNKSSEDDLKEIFSKRGPHVIYTNNVMPELGRLDVDSCNRVIRNLFISRIVDAKGIGKARSLSNGVLMPTPAAVLAGARLLSEGHDDVRGIGELMVVDLGGATTDVHSIAFGNPKGGVVAQVGIPEPYVKRTVEGDLGLKFNIDRLIELAEKRGHVGEFQQIAARHSREGFIPLNEMESDCHTLLSNLAVDVAVNRHAGRIEIRQTPAGEMLLQYGKDFTEIQSVIGTGGPILNSKDPKKILSGALFKETEPYLLKPKNPDFYLDTEYIMYAGGLLGQIDPKRALQFMKKHLSKL